MDAVAFKLHRHVKDQKKKKMLERLDAFIKTTEYKFERVNGQRIFGPPKDWVGAPPGPGTEIFIGKLPRHVMEDTVMDVFSFAGKIFMLRMMVDFDDLNRGFAFLTYATKEGADLALRVFNDFEISDNKKIGVFRSIDNRRLFLNKIPNTKYAWETKEELDKFVSGIVDIIMYPSRFEKNRWLNRGYIFIEFDCHKSAAVARKILTSGVKLWGSEPVSVDWADPIPEVDDSVMSNVKTLYMRNIGLEITNTELQALIHIYISPIKMQRIYKLSDFAFLHFECREDAAFAMRMLNGQLIGNNFVETTWARPSNYSKRNRMNATPDNFCRSVPPRMRKNVMKLKYQQMKNKENSPTRPGPRDVDSSIINHWQPLYCAS